MASKLILVLAALATLSAVCYGDEHLFSKSNAQMPSDPEVIKQKLIGSDELLSEQQVFDLASALPERFFVTSWTKAMDLTSLATLKASKCYAYSLAWYKHQLNDKSYPKSLRNFKKFCYEKLEEYCKSLSADELIGGYFSFAGKEILLKLGKYIEELKQGSHIEYDEENHANKVAKHCKVVVRAVNRELTHLNVKPEQVVAYLEAATKLPVDKYVEDCRAYIKE